MAATENEAVPARGRLRIVGGRTLGCLLALLALELGLGFFGGFGKWTVQERDRFLGWRMLPDQHAWSRDLTVPEDINWAGFRDREWERAPRGASRAETRRDPLLFRVSVVGNSMTYGTSDGRADYQIALEVIADYADVARTLVTHRFALDDVNTAFETALDKSTGSIKVHLNPSA